MKKLIYEETWLNMANWMSSTYIFMLLLSAWPTPPLKKKDRKEVKIINKSYEANGKELAESQVPAKFWNMENGQVVGNCFNSRKTEIWHCKLVGQWKDANLSLRIRIL